MLEVYGAPFRRLCTAYIRDHARQEDLFQEIALALWTALPAFRAEASERTWAYRIAHNVAFTYSARHRRRQSSEHSMETPGHDPAVELDLEHHALLEAVHQLGPADRNIALLYLEGLSGKEIAEVTGLTVDNVGVRLTRLRRKLAVLLRGKEVAE